MPERDVEIPEDAVAIDFEEIRDNDSDSWQRATDASPDVRLGDRDDLFVVQMDDSDDAHNLSIAEVRGGPYLGWCSCEGFEYHDYCAHLCVIRQRAVMNDHLIPTIDEDPRDDVDADVVDHAEPVQEGDDDRDDGDDDQADSDDEERPDATPVEAVEPQGSADEGNVPEPTTPDIAPITPGSVPEQGPVESAPGWALSEVQERGGDLDLNKDGCQFVAAVLGVDTDREFLERAETTGFEYAICECTARLGDRSVTRTATAHIDESNVAKHDMNRMAETRAYKRAVKSITGGGLLALAVDELDLPDQSPDRARTDGGRR